MNGKREKIEAIIQQHRGSELAPHYLGFIDCFNQQLFYEAHEVLEVLWLGQRQGPDGLFYKALIQLAGAFVHIQKHRLGPAAALFTSAHAYFGRYPAIYKRLDVKSVSRMAEAWLDRVKAENSPGNLLSDISAPKLSLVET